MSKRALITGISGQDGSYLSELLLKKDYEVIGATNQDTPASAGGPVIVHGDIADQTFVEQLVREHQPDEIYNLASVATVAQPWEDPVLVSRVTGMAPLYFLDAITRLAPAARFFQASSAELFGHASVSPQDEHTPYAPINPYGASKLFAHQMCELYREQGVFAVSGILFNHESSRRPLSFVTRKITNTLARIARGEECVLELGNLDAHRDWSFAGDIVEGMWLSLQHEVPGTYVFASGESHTVREFVEEVARQVQIAIAWEGIGIEEKGKDATGKIIVAVNSQFYRPIETGVRLGNPAHAQKTLGWTAHTPFPELVRLMVGADVVALEQSN